MATAETVMAVYSDRGKRGLPLEGVYRQLYSRDLYLRAYGRIHRNKGAMTPGVTAETVDAMSLEKIDGIIGVLRREAYRWSPARRTHIPKKNGKEGSCPEAWCKSARSGAGPQGGVADRRACPGTGGHRGSRVKSGHHNTYLIQGDHDDRRDDDASFDA